MKKTEKEIENLINESLNSDQPSPNVTSEAKRLMLKRNESKTLQKPFSVKRLIAALTPPVVAVVAVICCIPFFLNRGEAIVGDKDLTSTALASIQSYNEGTGNTVLSMDYAVVSCTLYSDSAQTPIYLREVYSDDGTEISLYVVLTEIQTELSAMEKFENLSKNTVIEGIVVSYDYVNAEYLAKCKYGNYEYLLASSGGEEDALLQYVRDLIS